MDNYRTNNYGNRTGNYGRTDNYNRSENFNNRKYNKKNDYRSNQFEGSTFNNGTFTDTPYGNDGYDGNTINAENLNIETTLNDISRELRPGETLVLDIGNNYFHQTDEIYDTLVMRGYEVKKSFKNGRNQIIVSKKA